MRNFASTSKDVHRVCCAQHPDAHLIEDSQAGDQICSECGLVVGDRVIDVGSEWRTFSNETAHTDRSRVGAPEDPLLGGSALSTIIGPSPRGAPVEYYGAKYRNRRTMSSSDKTILNASKEITTMAERINITKNISDRACILFKHIWGHNLVKGRSSDNISSACLYIACRQEAVPRTFKEICAVSKGGKKEIGRCFKLILNVLEQSVDLIDTNHFMPRFCANLGLPMDIEKAAAHIANKVTELDIAPGRSPLSVTAAAIYMASQASNNKRTQKEIGDIAGVADVTIRQSYKLMYPKASELFPPEFIFTTLITNLPQL